MVENMADLTIRHPICHVFICVFTAVAQDEDGTIHQVLKFLDKDLMGNFPVNNTALVLGIGEPKPTDYITDINLSFLFKERE